MTPSTFYLDASALVKRYMAEQGTKWVEALCEDEENNAIAIAHIGLVEVAAAFAAKRRGHFITSQEHQQALNDLINDAQYRYQLVSTHPDIIDSAIQLTGRRKRIISIVRGKKPGFSEKPGFSPFKPQVIERIHANCAAMMLFTWPVHWPSTDPSLKTRCPH